MADPNREVVCIRTGTANLASVVAAFGRLGIEVRMTESPEEVLEAPRVVLPGVGAFAAGMGRLHDLRLIEPLRRRVAEGRALLGICLGLQLLCESSEEAPGVTGVGVVPARVTRFPASVRVPQLGWNRLDADPSCGVLRSGTVYYANSYRVGSAPPGWRAATTDYAGPFSGGLERGPVVLCQFHPELSGRFGLGLLARWCEVTEAAPC